MHFAFLLGGAGRNDILELYYWQFLFIIKLNFCIKKKSFSTLNQILFYTYILQFLLIRKLDKQFGLNLNAIFITISLSLCKLMKIYIFRTDEVKKKSFV
jgi:hypothetical protein